MKPLVIYHADCTDGYGAAFAAWLKLGDEAEYLPMNYSDTSPDMMADKCRDREVYVLDFSFPRLVMDHIVVASKKLVWRDHHKSAFENWTGGYEKGDVFCSDSPAADIILDDNKSGALLAWEYFHPGTEIPMLIQHIDDRDRWQWKMAGSAELHAALGAMQPWSFEQWRSYLLQRTVVTLADRTRYQHDEELLLDAVYTQGSAILRAQKQHVEQMAKQARKCVIQVHVEETNVRKALQHFDISPDPSFSGLAVNASIHQSEVGHELANASGTFGLVWYVASDNRVRCSLRSNGDYDVSSIARSFGGGGHRNAAGFETDVETLMGWLHA